MGAIQVAINLVAQNSTNAAFSAFDASLLLSLGRLHGLINELKGAAPAFVGLGVAAFAAKGTFEAFANVTGLALDQATELETGLLRLRFATQENAADMPLLTAAITDLAVQTMYGVNDASGAFEQLVEMGFSTKDILYGMSDGANALMDGMYHAKEATQGLGMQALYLGQALGVDANDAARLLGATLHTFEADGMDAAGAANYLAAAFFNGVPDAQLLEQAIRNGGSTAAAAGINFKDFIVTLDMLSQAGLPANQAATSLNYYISQLSSPTSKAAKALADLGLITVNTGPKFQTFAAHLRASGAAGRDAVAAFDGTVTSLQGMYEAGKAAGLISLDKSFNQWAIQAGILNNAMYDADGNFIGLKDSALKLQDALGGIDNKASKLGYIRDIFNIRGGQDARLLTAMDDFAVKYDAIATRFEKTDVGELGRQQLETLAGALDQLKDTTLSALATAFLPLLPTLTELIGHVTDIASAFQNADPKVKTAVAAFLLIGTVITGLTAVILGVIVGIAALAAAITTLGIPVAALVGGLGAVAGGVVLLGGVVAGVVALQNQTSDSSGITRFFTDVTHGLGSAKDASKETSDAYDSLGVHSLGLQGYTKQLTGVYAALHDEMTTASNVTATNNTNMHTSNDEMDGALKRLPKVQTATKDTSDETKTYSDNAGTLAGQLTGLGDNLSHLGDVFGQIGETLGQFEGVWNVLKFIVFSVVGIIISLVTMLAVHVLSKINAVIMFVGGFFEFIGGLLQFLLGFIGGFLGVLGDIIHGDLDKVQGDMEKAFSDMGEGLGHMWQGFLDMIHGIWDWFVGSVIAGAIAFVQTIISWFQNLFDELVGHSIIPDMVKAILKWIGDLWTKFTTLIHDLVVKVLNRFGELKDKAITKLGELVLTAQDKAGDLKKKLLDAISQLPSKAGETFQSLLDTARKKLDSLKTMALDAGRGLVQNLIDGINGMLQNLKNKVADLASIISNPLHHSVPTEGPLKDDDQWGGHLVDNLITGIEGRLPALKRTIGSVTASMVVTPQTAAHAAAGAGQGGTVVIPVNLDGKQVAEYTLDLATRKLRKSGATRYAR